ncbi:MAG: T9SS type A sorting domain-containing protein, partial [Flavobacteriaceae bacterium]|nr:T9SS type A sorting domain-containing protein [Flavobacteriaceae bacterium]
IEVYNILGVLVQTINNIDTKDFKFVNNKLKTGTYIYKITNITGEKYTGKFIIN